MSDGHYCLVRDLGPVKGGKGLKHHEVVVDFTPRGIRDFAKRLIVARVRAILQRPPNQSHFEAENLPDLP